MNREENTSIGSDSACTWLELEIARGSRGFSAWKVRGKKRVAIVAFVAEGRHHRRGTNEQERAVEGCFAQQDRPLQVHKRRDTKRQGSKAWRARGAGEVGPEV